MEPPAASREQIAKLDEHMVASYGISVTMMMEQAAYRIAELLRMRHPDKKRVLICAGKGNNGGDGIAAARHLRNFGYQPTLFLMTEELGGEPARQLEIAKRLETPIITEIGELDLALPETELLLDCLIGYNLRGELRDEYKEAVLLLNESGKPIVACDVPSGVDADEGAIHEPHIRAESILYLSLPKKGCRNLPCDQYVADIGVPAELYPLIGLPEKNHFAEASILKLPPQKL